MKTKYLNCLHAASVLFILLAFCSCSKKSDPSGGGNTNPDTTKVKPFVYNYASLADSLQNATYVAFISADRDYYIQNNSGNNTLDLR